VNHVLIWVRPQDEELVRQAFDTALQKLDAALLDEPARLRAETEFFEQVVRVHREGEGETYEGLKPGGASEEEGLADQAVASGMVDDLLVRVHSEENKLVVKQLFQTLRDNAEYETSDLAAGRAYVRTYTAFIHDVGPAIRGEKLSGQSHNHSGR
jgi:hypothetical protein